MAGMALLPFELRSSRHSTYVEEKLAFQGRLDLLFAGYHTEEALS